MRDMLKNPNKKVYAVYFQEERNPEPQVLVFKTGEEKSIEEIRERLFKSTDLRLEITEIRELSKEEEKKFEGIMIDVSLRK
jgi:hypothetical protein